jgi:hypothetical protein
LTTRTGCLDVANLNRVWNAVWCYAEEHAPRVGEHEQREYARGFGAAFALAFSATAALAQERHQTISDTLQSLIGVDGKTTPPASPPLTRLTPI